MNGDGDVNRKEVRFTINGGGILDFGTHPEFSDGASVTQSNPSAASSVDPGQTIQDEDIQVMLKTLSENFNEHAPPSSGQPWGTDEDLAFFIEKKPDNQIGVKTSDQYWVSNGGFALIKSDEDDDHFYGMTDYGALVAIFDPEGTDSAETVTIEYPLEQRTANVFVLGSMGELHEDCQDDDDNDLDGLIDCQDPDCFAYSFCAPPTEICNDGIDNDYDNKIDCLDSDCAGGPDCKTPGPTIPEVICDDQIDNDDDHKTDCEDVIDCGGYCFYQLQAENEKLHEEIKELKEQSSQLQQILRILQDKVEQIWCQVFGCR
jgi:hypothetical protein